MENSTDSSTNQSGRPTGAPEEHSSGDAVAASERQRELIVGVSHDLRGRLGSLQLVATALADGILEPDLEREYLKQMPVHVGALVALVEDLFELSRLEAGDPRSAMHPVDMHAVVRKTVEGMQMEAGMEGVTLTVDVPPGTTLASGSAGKLERVLRNLIENALHHTPRCGTVDVVVRATADSIEVDVTDTGTGITELDRDEVFEPFVRGTGASPTGGTGLGLTVCRAIVEAHGGRIWLAETGEGTRVRFSLPQSE